MVFVYITRHIVDHVINIELSPKVNTRQTPLSLSHKESTNWPEADKQTPTKAGDYLHMPEL